MGWYHPQIPYWYLKDHKFSNQKLPDAISFPKQQGSTPKYHKLYMKDNIKMVKFLKNKYPESIFSRQTDKE